MKIKGISFWEQHLERFVLAAAALTLVVFAAMQFIGQPNAAVIAGQRVAPGDVDRLLAQRATEIADKLRADAAPPGSEDAAEPVLEQFTQRLAASVCPEPSLHAWQPAVGPDAEGIIPPPDKPFVIAAVPAPFDIAPRQYFDTLVPEVIADHAELQERFSAEPFDVIWNTIAARFNVAEIERQWKSGGPNGELPLLTKWFSDRVDFINLKIEREELVGGQWANLVVLDPMPGQFHFRKELAGKIDAPMRDAIVAHAANPAVRAAIIQPEFYPTKASSWRPPSDESPQALEANQPDANQPLDPAADLKAKIAQLTAERDRIEAKLRELNCPEEEPQRPPPNRGRGGGGGGSAPGSGGVGDGGRSGGMSGPTPTVTNEVECKRLRGRLKGLSRSLERFQQELEKIPGAQPLPEPQPQEVKPPEDVIWVWGHDLDVKPGKTYRYRVTVQIHNPLFARRLDLIAEQQDQAETFLLSSAPSEWSGPITVHPPLRLFVTHARASGQIGGIGTGAVLGQATAEVYRFRDGRWWRESFTVYPGDRIGVSARSARGGLPAIDFATDWFVLDVVEAVGVDREQIESGTGAVVLLQNLSDQSAAQVRRPADDKVNRERQTLRHEADTAAQLAGGAG